MSGGYNVGDDNPANDTIDPGEIWEFKYDSIATTTGQYENYIHVRVVDTTGAIADASDPSHYYGANPDIHVEKHTLGQDADTPTGPYVTLGDPITWYYYVTNPGNVTLDSVDLTDSDATVDATMALIGGDDNSDGKLQTTETWIFQATGTATTSGQYSNTATAATQDALGQEVEDTDPSHYFGADPGIDVEKFTNDEDADSPTGPYILAGQTAYWRYEITNTGNVPMVDVALDDDMLAADPIYSYGDAAPLDTLDVGETWVYFASGIAVPGQYENMAAADATDTIGEPYTDDDLSHYFGGNPIIHVEKSTNGFDADDAPGPYVLKGDPVYWRYEITNPGNVPLVNVALDDDMLDPDPLYSFGDLNDNDMLEAGETWVYFATGTAGAGQYENIATAMADDTVGNPVLGYRSQPLLWRGSGFTGRKIYQWPGC